jgi:phytoene synthase
VARDTSFSYSFLVLPDEQRQAIGVVWDFCRAVDDAVDEAPDEVTAAREIGRWRDEVGRLFGGQAPLTAQGRNLAPVVAAFSLSRPPFDDLVDGVEMAVGLMCIEIFGARDSRSRDYAFNLGLALQLTNIIRDIAVDLKNGRVYLPQEDLERFGVSVDDLRAGVVTSAMRNLLAHQCQRARQFYTAAAQAMPHADAHKLVAAEIMGGIYFEILQRIERRHYDVFTELIRVPKAVRARVAISIWARGQLSALGYRLFSRA